MYYRKISALIIVLILAPNLLVSSGNYSADKRREVKVNEIDESSIKLSPAVEKEIRAEYLKAIKEYENARKEYAAAIKESSKINNEELKKSIEESQKQLQESLEERRKAMVELRQELDIAKKERKIIRKRYKKRRPRETRKYHYNDLAQNEPTKKKKKLPEIKNKHIEKIVKKFTGHDGYTIVNINEAMFDMIPTDKKDMDGLGNVIDGLQKITIITFTPPFGDKKTQINSFFKKVNKELPKNYYTDIMSVDEKDSKVRFKVRKSKDVIVEFLMISCGSNEATLIWLAGNIDLGKISNLTKGLNLQKLMKPPVPNSNGEGTIDEAEPVPPAEPVAPEAPSKPEPTKKPEKRLETMQN